MSGLLGLGGGIILVPTLAWLFKTTGFPDHLIMHMAIATSLSSIIATSVASVYAHHSMNGLFWNIVLRLTPPVAIGALLGAFIAQLLSTELLKQIFALFLIGIAAQIAFGAKPEAGESSLSNALARIGGVMIGTLSSLLGIGGGSMTVPLLVYANIPTKNAVAISAACSLPIAITGSLGYLIIGWNAPQLPEASLGYIYLPALVGIMASSIFAAPLGAKLAHRLPAKALKTGFALLLAAIGLKLLY